MLVTCFVDRLMQGEYYEDALRVFGDAGINEAQYQLLMERAEHSAFSDVYKRQVLLLQKESVYR